MSSSEEPSEEKAGNEPATYHPSAPLHEAFDISTTVDPCYIISLIRHLIPLEHGKHSFQNEADNLQTEGSTTEKEEFLVGDTLGNGAARTDEVMHTAETSNELLASGGLIDNGLHLLQKHENGSVKEVSWEEYGCTLWDLAASETHAQLMVENFILDVLLANLMVSHSARVKEICLGIMGNLACHEVTRQQICSKDRLTETIVEQLFLDDAPCLCEAFRLLTLCFQFGDVTTWKEALNSDHILSRIMWIAENALNIQLIEKSVGFILALLGCQENTATVLLPPLVTLGLPGLLVNLLDFEIKKLTQEDNYERCCVLDKVLQAIEALSGVDKFSSNIHGNKELFKLLIDLVKLPSKNEICSSCISAVLLIANILHDTAYNVSEVSQDMGFLQGILSIFPLTSDDDEAKSALWSIIATVLKNIKDSTMSRIDLYGCVAVLVSNYDVIDDAILDHQDEDNSIEEARTLAMESIFAILSEWKLFKESGQEIDGSDDNSVDDEDVDRLLECCCRFIRSHKVDDEKYYAKALVFLQKGDFVSWKM